MRNKMAPNDLSTAYHWLASVSFLNEISEMKEPRHQPEKVVLDLLLGCAREDVAHELPEPLRRADISTLH